MFNNVLRCLVSLAMIGIAASATADCLRDRDNVAGIGDNSAGNDNNCAEISDNSAEIGDDAAEIVDITAKVIPC